MIKKEITTNDLALMIGKGFAGVDEYFKKVNQRFDEVATKDELKLLKREINERFDKIEKTNFRGP